ncbi:hypothetical protein ANAPH2_01085 [Anaplasma phagocytophilum]|nr:hypothetical protein ANAPH2_00351 [Anaplasma phagocytophilum]SCV64836.1 hypothetical protein ANAPH2_01085 [Anaplasma phagocytophilum]
MYSKERPIPNEILSKASIEVGKNSCNGGSSSLMVICFLFCMSLNIARKSSFCTTSIFLRARSRSCLLLARIISRTIVILLSEKNMCSVLHSPIPSAPKRLAVPISSTVSAFAITPTVLISSIQPINS